MDILLLIIQIATLVFLIIYVIKTWHIASATRESAKATEKSADISRQVLEEMRENRDQETAPYVFVYFDMLIEKQYIYLYVKNIGKSIAHNVRLEFEPKLENSLGTVELPFIKDGIGSLPPGAEIRTFLDIGTRYFEKNELPSNYEATISYYGGIEPKERNNKQLLDMSAIKVRYIVEKKNEKTMNNLVNEIVRLTNSVNGISEKLDKKEQNDK